MNKNLCTANRMNTKKTVNDFVVLLEKGWWTRQTENIFENAIFQNTIKQHLAIERAKWVNWALSPPHSQSLSFSRLFLHTLASFACTLARLSQSFSLALFLARAPWRARSLLSLSSSRSRCQSHSHSHSLSLWLVCIWYWLARIYIYLYLYYLCACVRVCVCVRACVYANVHMRAFVFLFSDFFPSLCVITCVSVFQVASESDSACTSACQCVCVHTTHLQRQWWCVPFKMVKKKSQTSDKPSDLPPRCFFKRLSVWRSFLISLKR